jgi:hypothetical protein
MKPTRVPGRIVRRRGPTVRTKTFGAITPKRFEREVASAIEEEKKELEAAVEAEIRKLKRFRR